MKIKLASGMNRVSPPHELKITQDGFIECALLQNFICRNNKITKIGGTEAYNSSDLGTAIPWVYRSYHKRGDGSFRKVGFCFSNGVIYYGDDVTGTLTSCQTGFTVSAIPMQTSIQVSGNSTLYFISGEDEVYKYDGNGSYVWEMTSVNTDAGLIAEGGAVHLDKVWWWFKNSSSLIYSGTLNPEYLEDEIIVGQDTDSYTRAVVVGSDESLYVFKNNGIWRLYGRTPATFELRRVTDKYGLANKRCIYPVGGGYIFLDEFTKELYFFGGTEISIKSVTEDTVRLREILDTTEIDQCTMTLHDRLFRFAFKHKDDNIYQDRELIYAIDEPNMKWTMSKGAKIYSYSVWNQQEDKNELVTGRSDVGKLMYHNRSNNFDGTAIETRFRTGEVVASEDKVMRFTGFYIKGEPGSTITPLTFRYYLDGRINTSGSGTIDSSGEVSTLGEFKLSQQELFNNRVIPLHAYSRGNSISFEIVDFNLNTSLEIYSIALKAKERYKIRNALHHVA